MSKTVVPAFVFKQGLVYIRDCYLERDFSSKNRFHGSRVYQHRMAATAVDLDLTLTSELDLDPTKQGHWIPLGSEDTAHEYSKAVALSSITSADDGLSGCVDKHHWLLNQTRSSPSSQD